MLSSRQNQVPRPLAQRSDGRSSNFATKALVWPVAMYGCESWTFKKDDEKRISAFEMKCLRQVLRVSWTAKSTNEWVLETAGVSRSLLASVKEMKLSY